MRLRSDPPLTMLKGEFSGGRIAMRNVDLGGVRAEKASIDLDPFDIDVWDTMKNGRVVDREPLSGALEIEVSEDEIARLAQKGSEMPVTSVKVQKDGVLIRFGGLGARHAISRLRGRGSGRGQRGSRLRTAAASRRPGSPCPTSSPTSCSPGPISSTPSTVCLTRPPSTASRPRGKNRARRQGAEHSARRLSRRLITRAVVAMVSDGRVPGGGISKQRRG